MAPAAHESAEQDAACRRPPLPLGRAPGTGQQPAVLVARHQKAGSRQRKRGARLAVAQRHDRRRGSLRTGKKCRQRAIRSTHEFRSGGSRRGHHHGGCGRHIGPVSQMHAIAARRRNDRGHHGSELQATGQPRAQRVDELFHPARQACERAAPQARRLRLCGSRRPASTHRRAQGREGGPQAELPRVGQVNAGKQRLPQDPEQLRSIAPLHERADALVAASVALGHHGMRQSAKPARQRQQRRTEKRPRPPGMHQPHAGRNRHQPAAARDVGAARLPLGNQRVGKTQLAAQIDGGALAGQEGVRPRLDKEAVTVLGAQLAAGARRRLQQHHFEGAPLLRHAPQVPGGGQAGDAAPHHHDPRQPHQSRDIRSGPPHPAPGPPAPRSAPDRCRGRACG